MKKYIAILLTIMLMLLAVPFVGAVNSESDIKIQAYEIIPEGPIKKDQSFILKVTLSNNSLQNLTQIKLNIDPNNSFIFENGNAIAINGSLIAGTIYSGTGSA